MVKRRAFTLIEVLVVVALLALLASIAAVTHRNSARKGRETVLRHNLQQIRATLDQYHHDKGYYPPDLATLTAEGYLREIPVDPITRASDTWVLIYDEPLDEDSSYEIGIFDVRSGSEEQAMDGTYYHEW